MLTDLCEALPVVEGENEGRVLCMVQASPVPDLVVLVFIVFSASYS